MQVSNYRFGDVIKISFVPGILPIYPGNNPCAISLEFIDEQGATVYQIYRSNSPTNADYRTAIGITTSTSHMGITGGIRNTNRGYMDNTHWIEFHISTKQTKVVRCYGVNNTIETHVLPKAGLPLISSIIGKRMKIWTHNICNPDGVSHVSYTGISITPSESYADDFATDTTERYQPVTGTVAYDDVNKRMNVTTATEANGKASGRLKSYKFCEGAQQFDVMLPVGADGDFICMVTHATNGAMDNGIGVGLQSDGAGNWNLATLSGTTVTVGASSGLTDGKTARIEIEKDITGAYWYYIYDAAGTKPTTATGKLFTTLSEGYTGWYANGNSKTYAIENISIRAESIVGRTNVQVTEDVFNSVTGEIESRTYFKPIHRGAMLETYHDGTQEVVGTTFIDDCQWDRSGEYTTYSGIEVDTTTGQIVNTAYNNVLRDKTVNQIQPGNGVYSCYISPLVRDSTAPLRCGIKICKNVAGSSASTYIYAQVSFHTTSSFDNSISILRYVDSSRSTLSRVGLNRVISLGEWVKLVVEFNHPTVKATLYDLSGNIIATATAESVNTPTSGYCGISFHPGVGTAGDGRMAIRDFQFIAASPDATNGIAACIPPIGGGARYGVEESVYNTFTTENVNKGVYLTTAKVKTTNPNADEVSLEYTNDTTSITLNTTPIDVDATYTVKTAPITIDANETDTLRVSVKNSTTCVQSTNYVDSLSLIPVSGDDVLYPQDLAFISGVKPSQKRKVEVK
jgi:hypothetical protein